MSERLPTSPVIYENNLITDVYSSKLFRMVIGEALDYSADAVEGLGEIRIVERKESLPDDYDCHRFVFGYGDVGEQLNKVFSELSPSNTQIPGAVAMYVSESGSPIHVGIVTEEGNILSKWEYHGHVYEHAPLRVPLNYGSNIVYFSEENSTI